MQLINPSTLSAVEGGGNRFGSCGNGRHKTNVLCTLRETFKIVPGAHEEMLC